MTQTHQMTLGELIATLYDELYEIYGDDELTAVAATTIINDILAEPAQDEASLEDAA